MGGSTRAAVFSGHESFACRYGWLPKLYEASSTTRACLHADEHAILRLGVGPEHGQIAALLGEAFGITHRIGRDVLATEFARMLLDTRIGFDPYLETPGTLWRLHWILTVHAGLGAWALAFLEMQDREITREKFVASVRAYAARSSRAITSGTASNHVNVFLRTVRR